ncbi:hypothetical protein [Rothia mucilaginosa]
MKIQEVIDEVNEAWGEEHEEKRKKIFRENILWKPLGVFRDVSLFYLFATLVFGVFHMFGPRFEGAPNIFSPAYVFNFPYYFFDVRAGIIASLASILLSLYVSVGKFADGAEGITGDARRAVYRNFAQIVGGFVSVVLILNFWHGFLAGYFQGSSYAPKIFDQLSHGSEWGKYIVPEDIDLSRYAEVPLWILLFFAWFTLASSYMLTYNEKDILVRNALTLRRLRKMFESENVEYNKLNHLIMRSIDDSGLVSGILDKKLKALKDYVDRLPDSSDYQGFRFVLPRGRYKKDKSVRKGLIWWGFAIFLWILFPILVKFLGGFLDDASLNLLASCVSSIFLLSVLEIFRSIVDKGYLYEYVCNIISEDLGRRSGGKGKWLDAYRVEKRVEKCVIGITYLLVVILAILSLLAYLVNLENLSNLVYAFFITLVFGVSVFLVNQSSKMIRAGSRINFYQNLIMHSEKYLPDYIKYASVVGVSNNANISKGEQYSDKKSSGCTRRENERIIEKGEFYLLVACIYCMVLKVHTYYSEYKSEIGAFESEAGEVMEHKSEIKKTPDVQKVWWNRLRMKGHK